MTELLERAIRRVQAMPHEAQDAFARVLLQLAGEEPGTYRLSAEEEADLDAAEDEAARGEFVEDGAVAAILSKYDR